MGLTIGDKLKLITEGFAIEDINSGKAKPSNTSVFNTVNETSLFFESVNIDVQFICETSIDYLQESTFDTIKDKVIRIVNWFIQKVQNIIKWIKEKFSNNSKMEKTIKSIEQKEKSGELERKIQDIGKKSSNEEKSLVVNAFENIFKGIKPITQYAEKLSRFGDVGLTNFFHNKPVFNGITTSLDLNDRDEVVEVLMKDISGTVDISKFKEFYAGVKRDYHLTIADTSKVKDTYFHLKEEGEKLSTIYQDYVNKLNKWKDISIKIIDGARRDKAINKNPDIDMNQIQKNISQLTALYAAIVRILNTFTWTHSDVYSDCEKILNHVDSL